MNQFHVDDRFSNALRAGLVSQVAKEAPATKRKRSRVWLGSGALAGAGLLGVGAATAGLFLMPGGEKVTPLASPVTITYTGTATVELGIPPEGTTVIQMKFWCLTPGWFEFPDGAASSCSEEDAANDGLDWSGYTISLSPARTVSRSKLTPRPTGGSPPSM